MIGATVAISDFMIMLVSSALWVGGGVLGAGVVGAGALGGAALAVRRWRRSGKAHSVEE